MVWLLSLVSRAGLALSAFLFALAVLRWSPVLADPRLDLRALSLAPPLLSCAVVAALTGRRRRPGPWRRLLAALVLASAALAVVVALRGPGGLPASVAGPRGALGHLRPGPIDLTGDDLEDIARSRRMVVRWRGALRVPASGSYLIHAVGRGRVEVALDGRRALVAEAEDLRATVPVQLGAGERTLDVLYERVGPGPRLRLEWTRARADGSTGGRREPLPPRRLGAAAPGLLWTLTDLLALAIAALLALLALAAPWDVPHPLPTPKPAAPREIAIAALAHIALVAGMTWPLVADLSGHGILAQPDGRLNSWILAWGAQALTHQPGAAFAAPIFHPLPDALAFSENLLLIAFLFLPAIALGGPVLGYNLALLLGDAASGLGVQLLVRRATGDSLAGFVGGALFSVGIHRFVNLAHLHAQFTPFLPFALLALDRFLERRTTPRALSLGLLLAAQGAASVYLGAITAVAVTVGLALAALGGLRGREALRAACGLLLAALLLAPLVRPYLRMRGFQGEEFRLETLASFATTLESYAASASPLYAPLSRRHLDPERVHDPLFPGLTAVVLGIAGLARAPRRFRALALVASALAIVLSLGPETAFYRFLHEHVVLFRGLRALARFSLIPLCSLAVLAGCALAGRRRAALLALALALSEAWSGPLRLVPYPGPSVAARSLAGGSGAVVALPLGEDDTQVMLDAIAHFRPLLNGDSGFVPRAYSRAMELLNAPLSEPALRFLRAAGVTQVLARGRLPLPVERELDGILIHSVPAGEAAREVVPARSRPTLMTPGGRLVDLGEEREIARLTFPLSDADWVARPRVWLSSDGRAWAETIGEADLGDAVLSLYRSPRAAHGELRMPPARARFVRLDPRLPVAPGTIGVDP